MFVTLFDTLRNETLVTTSSKEGIDDKYTYGTPSKDSIVANCSKFIKKISKFKSVGFSLKLYLKLLINSHKQSSQRSKLISLPSKLLPYPALPKSI